MLNGKIEKNVPFPPRRGGQSTFHRDFIHYLDRLEVTHSVVFQCEKHKAYILQTKIQVIFKIYGIIKGSEFVSSLDIDRDTVRIWRIK